MTEVTETKVKTSFNLDALNTIKFFWTEVIVYQRNLIFCLRLLQTRDLAKD